MENFSIFSNFKFDFFMNWILLSSSALYLRSLSLFFSFFLFHPCFAMRVNVIFLLADARVRIVKNELGGSATQQELRGWGGVTME